MGRLLKAAVLVGALAALALLVPIRGRTVADRWRAADGPAEFARRGWAELRGAWWPRAVPPGRAPAPRAGAQAGRASPGQPPVEGHTDADRRALEKLLGDHLADGSKR